MTITPPDSAVPEPAGRTRAGALRRSVTIDVVDLHRIARIVAESGPALQRRLLHPCERMDPSVHNLATALAVKESWIKGYGDRPPGWRLGDAAVFPADESELPAHARPLLDAFVEDLAVTDVRISTVDPYVDRAAHGGSRWAWTGVYEHWLIAAVLT